MVKPTVLAFFVALVLSLLSNVARADFPPNFVPEELQPTPEYTLVQQSALDRQRPEYGQGILAAQSAWQATSSARSSRDWQGVAQWWARAADAMQSVPSNDPRWILAQKKTREYLAGSAFAFKRAEESESEPVNWTFGSSVLDEKLALYAAHVAASGVPEIAIVGSSRASQGIDPTVLQQTLEQRGKRSMRSLNLGVNGATAQVVDRFVREILPGDRLPRRIIWGVGVRAFNSGRFDRTDRSIRESPGYRAQQRGEQIAIRPNDIDGSSAIRADGFLPIETRFSFERYYRDRNPVAGQYDGNYVNFSLAGEQGAATERFLNFTKAKNIEVVLVPIPLTVSYLDATRNAAEWEFRQYLDRLAGQYSHVTTIDLEATMPDRNFQDPSHLNRYGAVEVSRQIAQRLQF